MTTTITTPETAEEKMPDDAVTLVPVPDEDIIKFAKAKCSLCLGLGKLRVTAVGGADPKTLVCNCAIKRFIAANSKRLAVSRDNHVAYRFKVMNERIAIIDKKLAEIGQRYARQLLPLQNDEAEAALSLSLAREEYNVLKSEREKLADKVSGLRGELADLVETEKRLRSELDREVQLLLRTDAAIEAETVRLQPFHEAVSQAKDKVDTLAKRQYQAMKPGEQRKASLLKRMSHKAASLGLSVDDIASKAST